MRAKLEWMKCSATAAAWFSTFFENALVSRVHRRMDIRRVPLVPASEPGKATSLRALRHFLNFPSLSSHLIPTNPLHPSYCPTILSSVERSIPRPSCFTAAFCAHFVRLQCHRSRDAGRGLFTGGLFDRVCSSRDGAVRISSLRCDRLDGLRLAHAERGSVLGSVGC